MTFKHTKFEDSPTMRSLIKVAAEKGWVKSEPIEKTASVQEDVSPTENLTENIIKLCAGLRKSGMNKVADELETKFVAYKQANTMYDVHNEKGEDLVDAAHPKGGHKMENVEGDALVETILEKHLKMLDVVNKKPSGKLASHQDILNAVKVVLGEESSATLAGLIGQAQAKYDELIKSVGGQSPSSNQARLITVAPIVRAWKNDAGGPTDATVKKGLASVANAKYLLMFADEDERKRLEKVYNGEIPATNPNEKFRWLALTNSYSNWNNISAMLDSLTGILNSMAKVLGGDTGLIAKMDALIVKLNSYKSLLLDEGFTPEDRTQGNAWIDSYTKTLNNWKSVFSGLDAETKTTEAPRYEKKLAALKANVDAFYKQLTSE